MHLRISWLLAVFLLLLPSLSLQAQAQPPTPLDPGTSYLAFAIIPESTYRAVALSGTARGPDGTSIGDVANFNFRIIDQSVNPGAQDVPVPHRLTMKLEWIDSDNPDESTWDRDPAWQFIAPTSEIPTLYAGDVVSNSLALLHLPSASTPVVGVRLTANLSVQSDPKVYLVRTEEFYARIQPAPGLQLTLEYGMPNFPLNAPPDTWVRIPVSVRNTDLYPNHVILRLRIQAGEGVDPSAIPTGGDLGGVLAPQEERLFNLTFKTPKSQLYYSTSMPYDVVARIQGPDGITTTSTGVIIVQGFYISTQLKIGVALFVALSTLAILIFVFVRRYFQERVLGKPIPPWRIPEEAAKLQELRQVDPRAFYLTRYFFMEEEYQSALNWFYSFKKRTKRELQARAKAVSYEEKVAALAEPSLRRFDRRAERITRRHRARQDRQRLKLEAKLERLQAKLDQHYEEDYEKDHEKWEAQVEKVKKKASKPWFKAHKQWEAEVARINKEWEAPFRSEKAQADKARAKALAQYESKVKKEDKQAWRDWREAVENAEKENKIRKKEGREPVPMPELVSTTLGPPELPPPFKTPPRPKLPPEPKEPDNLDLPPEPELSKPKLEASHYARKAARARRKTDRKVRRLERKLERALAKNERNRVRAIAKADRKRNKLIDKRRNAFEPTILERLLHQTPEHREYRARRKLMKALADEKVRQLAESEKTRLEVLRVQAARQEAELTSKLIKERTATVRSGAAPSGMRIQPDKDPALASLRAKNQAQLERERRKSEALLKAERERIQKQLQAELTEELIKERARSRPPAAPTAQPAKPRKK